MDILISYQNHFQTHFESIISYVCECFVKLRRKTFSIRTVLHRMIDKNVKKLNYTFNVGYSIALTSAIIDTLNAQKSTAVPNLCDVRDLFTIRSKQSINVFVYFLTAS